MAEIAARAALKAAVVGAALAAMAPPAALASDPPGSVLAPTPLVLKDGRIATVSLHAVPFARGAEGLGAGGRSALERLAVAIADDCFLTAQVIGHIDPSEQTDGDTLRAHRIARSRADAVLGELSANGLPQTAIASVWDWQFVVKEPRASVWVFRLTPGEDCEGAPLAGGAAVASLDAFSSERAPNAAGDARSLSAEARGPGLGESLTARPAAGQTASGFVNDFATDLSADPAPETTFFEAPAVAPPPPSAPAMAALRPAEAEPLASPAAARVDVTFDVNSSFFPSGARQELREFLSRLDLDRALEIELVASVGAADDVRNANDEQALRYNRWMAERRLKRVAGWIEEKLQGRDITVRSVYSENDASRRVAVAARPR